MKRATRWITRHPWLVITGVIIMTVFMTYQLKNMRMDPDVTNALPREIPAKRLYDKMGDIFPSKEFVFVGITGDDLFTPDHVATVAALTDSLESFAEVYNVISPTNISLIQGTPDGMEVRDILQRLPETPAEMAAYKQDLFGSDLALGNLVSKDRQAFGIMIFVRNTADPEVFVSQLLPFMDTFEQATDLQFLLAGKPVVNHYVSLGMQRDMSVFFGGGLAVIFLLLLVVFRSIRGIVLPLTVVIMSVLWTMGLMTIFKIPMSHSTEILPILLMAIAVADSIHILSHYAMNAQTITDKKDLVIATMQEMNIPIIMTSLTTAAGFLALNTSGTESIGILGIFTAIGVLFALLISLTWLPAWLSVAPVPKWIARRDRSFTAQRFANWWGHQLLNFEKALVPFIIVVILLSAWGMTRLHHEFSSIENFPEDHPLRQANDFVNQHFAGTTSFQVMIEGNEPGAINSPLILKGMRELEQYAVTLDHVGDAQSLADFIARINKVLHNDNEAYNRIPDQQEVVTGTDWVQQNGQWTQVEIRDTVSGRDLVAQYLQLYEMSGKPDDFANLTDYDYQNAKLSIFINTDKQSVLRQIDNKLESRMGELFPNTTAAVTGMAKIIIVVDNLIVSGQIYSILASLGLVWLITSLMFRSPILGFYNTIPLFFALLLNFAIMGWFHIPLNLETMVTSSIAIGIGVDYAIHFVHRYRMKIRAGLTYAEAVPATMREAGVAIIINSITVALGFSIIAFSQFVAIAHMGILITLTMLTSAFGALTILPAFFLLVKPKALLEKSEE